MRLQSTPLTSIFEEARRGSLRPGKAADLVLLDADPLAVGPDALRRVRVLETVKAGETILPCMIALRQNPLAFFCAGCRILKDGI